MDWQKDGWKYVVVFLVVVALVWWRNQTPEVEEQLTKEEQVTQKANQFLTERGIQLPDGVERVDLEDVAGGAATGIVTRKMEGNLATITVLAGMPEQGNYYVWLKNQNEFKNLGKLVEDKGGMMLTYKGKDLSGDEEIIISRENKIGAKPTVEILRGQFGR